MDGWVNGGGSLTSFQWASGGYADGISGGDARMYSSDNLNLDILSTHNIVKIRMKNSSSDTVGIVYFQVNGDSNFTGAQQKSFSVIANDPNYTEYTVDMSEVVGWDGTLKRLRLDPNQLSGSGSSFSVDYIRIQSDALDAPSGLAATSSDGEVTLTWNAVSGAASYSVKRANGATGNYITIATDVTGTSYADEMVSNGIAYSYLVVAVDGSTESNPSAAVEATPQLVFALGVGTATATDSDSNFPAYAVDGNLATRWSALSDSSTASETITFPLDDSYVVTNLAIAWYRGDERNYEFRVEVSTDNSVWTEILGQTYSGGVTDQFESYNLPDTEASWVRLVCYGNNVNDYNSISEVLINGHFTSGIVVPAIDAVSSSSEYGATSDDNTVDGNLGTVWSADGVGEWIRYELVEKLIVSTIGIAWEDGDLVASDFTIEGSLDGSTWFEVLPLTSSSGASTDLEYFDLPDRRCAWIRITGQGNEVDDFISLSEVLILGYEAVDPVVDTVAASGNQTGHPPEDAVDGNVVTRWSQDGVDEWISFEFEQAFKIASIGIAWYRGDERQSDFEVEASSDGSNWTSVLGLTSSSGDSEGTEYHDVTDMDVTHIRILGYGNSINDWNSINEVEFFGY